LQPGPIRLDYLISRPLVYKIVYNVAYTCKQRVFKAGTECDVLNSSWVS